MKRIPKKKTCHKVGYKTAADARKALKDYGRARGSVRFYKCPHHKGETVYHLTSQGKP